MRWDLVFVVAAFVCFVLEALRVQTRFNLTAAGLALLTVGLAFPRV
jgi:hypothetical protein